MRPQNFQQARYIEMMQMAGEHSAFLVTLEPFEGMAHPETFAKLAYYYMRLAGLSPFDDNLNLNID
jgi:hypothetical protein